MTLPPVSRRGNPQTSKQAEAKIGDIRRSQIKSVVDVLRVAPLAGFHFSDVAFWGNLTDEQAKRRLADCKNLGLAYQEGTVKVGRYSRGLWHATVDGQLPLKPKTRTRHCPGCNCPKGVP